MENGHKSIKQLTFELQTIQQEMLRKKEDHIAFADQIAAIALEMGQRFREIETNIERENEGLKKIEQDLKVRLEECTWVMDDLLGRTKQFGQSEERNVISQLINKYSDLVIEFGGFISKFRDLLVTGTMKEQEYLKYKAAILEEKGDKMKQDMDDFARVSQSRIAGIGEEIEKLKNM